ncbi:glycosyltransferase, partial [Candidatus Saccharibacteria bacterium]|nr:glycosyltransferase [Candidatus Saccharibacteria bacterium]
FFGRLHAEKNPLFAHQVFQSIRKKEPNARFIMIGYGSQSPLVHAAIKDDPAIIYVKSTDRIHDYYQAVDAIIFPSISEGLGMVAIEAQYNGTPILASDTIPEDTRISNYIKYINLERGADYWAKKAISLSKLQKGCAKYLPNSQNFDIESQFARLENIYTECIKNDSTKIPLNEREKNSRKNMISAFLVNTVSIIIGFISQRIFIQLLGSEYLGLNSLFANVLSMLSITELGLGTAIIFNLYKPVAEGSIDKIRSLMAFYRNSYHRIAAAISILGLFVVPLLPLIVKFDSAPSGINLYLVYVLFLLDSVLSYLFSYKRGILYAHQKTYLVNAIHIAYIILVNIFQLSFLFITKSYYLYLIIKIIFRLLENVAISIVANRKYKYLTEAGAAPIDAVTKRDIFKKIKALFLHQVGYFIVLGSDNVIISVFLGLTSVGLYANYYLVINSVYTVLSQFISAATPSIGNLLVTEAPEKRFETFNRLRQLNFWLSTLASIAIYVLIQPFITIWIGKDFLLPESVLLTLVIHFFIRSNRSVYASFKDAAGIYHEDRLIPVVESVINIIASVILVQIYGLAGVFIGTIISSLVIWCYSYPKFIYKNLLGRSYTKYVKETVAHVIIFAVLLFTAHVIISAG